jgi:protoporphyrinogen oxidase
MVIILGAGLSGLSTADHLHKNNIPFKIYEAKNHGGGHIHSETINGFTWDEGPHVSFTKHDYVKQYFENNCNGKFLEYPTEPTNYFEGSWIPHPAQANMYAIPQPLRDDCVQDVVLTRASQTENENISNYQDWIDFAFGPTFARVFPKSYTIKYWTTPPENLTTDWIGQRIYFPDVSDMVESANGPLQKKTHYITKVRYPKKGGYYSFIKNVEAQLPVQYNKPVKYISFNNKTITFEDNETISYSTIVNTLPLPVLIQNSDAPDDIKACSYDLHCSEVLIINVIVDHKPAINNHWIYVYDENMYSTRINFTDLLSPDNGIEGKCGIQVEVYFSAYRKNEEPVEAIVQSVLKELIKMKLINNEQSISSYYHKWIKWANVIFDNKREAAQKKIFDYLETVGLKHESDEMDPMTNWLEKDQQDLGFIILAGRFAQWKYYWTDDCVMRGKYIAECLTPNNY